jgi:benzoylformate decarboxylase
VGVDPHLPAHPAVVQPRRTVSTPDSSSTPVQLDLPVTFLVLRNGGYGALRNFVGQLGVTGAPGLDLPGLDAVRIAEGYGMAAQRLTGADELAAALRSPTAGPRLIEVDITTETRAFG